MASPTVLKTVENTYKKTVSVRNSVIASAIIKRFTHQDILLLMTPLTECAKK